jgi:hypothetical protein
MYARFAVGFPRYLKLRVTPEEGRAEMRRRLAEREQNFLRWVGKAVFGHPRSPYRALFAHAGCEAGDLERAVGDHGLEGALERLRDAGVYVAYDEFKGRVPMVRGGREIPVAPGDFDNPFLQAAYARTSGGSTGPGTRVMTDLDNLRARAKAKALEDEILGLRDIPMGIWRGVLPDNGLNAVLSRTYDGAVPERWFAPVTRAQLRPSLEYRLATEYVLWMGRLCGLPMPRPEPVPIAEAVRVARWVAETVRARGSCHLRAYLSMLVRVAGAAREAGLDLTGAILGGAGEPPTPAKVAEIERSGARYTCGYHISEFGRVGSPCQAPLELNDQHFAADHLALIQRRRVVPGTDLEVDAFLFSTLLPSAPKLAINVESDDYGVVERRACGCAWEAEGLAVHVRRIRSFRKLTGEGMTLVGSEMLRLLEEVLPARFGGSATDYQLAEVEDERGLTRLHLRVSPSVDLASESAVIETVLAGLADGSPQADLARATWAAAGTFRVERREPVWTQRGKLLPLDLLATRTRGAGAPR